MKKITKAIIFLILTLFIILVTVFACKSDIWQQDLVLENAKRWQKLEEGWSVTEDKGSNVNSSITITKTFYPDEVYSILSKQLINTSLKPNPKKSEFADAPVIFFITHNQKVRVFADFGVGEKQLYSFGNNGKQYVGSECGTVIHCIPIPKATERNVILTIRFTPSYLSESLRINNFLYTAKKAKVPTFYFGWRTVCLNSYFRSCVFQAIPIFIILVLGIISLCIYLFIRIIRKKSLMQYLYWSFFALFCEIGFFCESRIGYYFAENSFSLYFISTIILSAYPLLFLQFMKERTTMPNKDIMSRIFTAITPINIFIVCLTAILPEFPFSLTRAYIMMILGLFVLFMIIITIREAITENGTFSAFDMILIISGTFILIDYLLYFIKGNITDFFFFSRFGMLLFFVVCGALIINETLNDELLKERSKGIEQSAYKDILTGCKNTASLWHDTKRSELAKEGFSLALFYIPNISEINIVDGYSAGDLAVKTVAQYLQQVFSEENVYRLSGTKFFIMMNNEQTKKYEKNKALIENLLDSFNEKNINHKIEIKSVMKEFAPNSDFDFEMLYFNVIKELHCNEKGYVSKNSVNEHGQV
ncbi:MAG: diguanylate cyclase [Treponema sp.]